ncbi:MAG: threonine--tRNA ligase [Patescibacteria group bacterium]|nr:threonine--tRNA ligase [Patescibacteria group bacterium]
MDEKLLKIRHTASHILAQAVLEIYPEAQLAIGPAIEDGFYYDFDLGDKSFTTEDLIALEKKMKKIIAANQKMKHYTEETDKSISYIKTKKQPYKLELAEDLKKEGETVLSFYTMVGQDGQQYFTDLCAGPHVDSTKEVKAIKLLKVAGAYWRGDEKRKMLQRIYGTAFESQTELDQYLEMLKQAEARDHRKLGKELELFVFSELVGPGMPLYTPRGTIVRRMIVNYSNELQQQIGYNEVHTPNLNKAELFKTSGHYDKFKADMLSVKSNYTDEEYFLKPMNCPMHTQIYASKLRSYKDLPVRLCDFANLYRDEKPGELHGLSRLRCFSQDDGHCFCREDQIEQEFTAVLAIIKKAMETYGMEYWIRLSLSDPKHPELYIGERSTWEKSEKLLEEILVKNSIKYKTVEGDAAFYGPKMDLVASDAIGRAFQISTVQLDFNMPQRFGLTYVDSDGSEKTPVMIHRAIVGSPERFMGILIEHYAGAFPTWLAPVQVQVIPVSGDFIENANSLSCRLAAAGIRVEVDGNNETVGYKIRKAEKLKIPYMLVLGEKEVASKKLAVRSRGSRDMNEMPENDFVDKILAEIKNRK